MSSEATVKKQDSSQKGNEKIQNIDYKMISFTLGGKDYGINILKVKEIRKAGNFTFVPNTPAFVRGVDNLRGDIIPIIDLRIMFNLPAPSKEKEALENIIILRLGELILGVIVESIEKVVGIDSKSIQPPHPIFGDINIKYISGVVENDGKLYIILDADRIFNQEESKEEEKTDPTVKSPEPMAESFHAPLPVKSHEEGVDINFIIDTLKTFIGFHVTPMNQHWVLNHYQEWKQQRIAAKRSTQLESKEEATQFLGGFLSAYSAQLWPVAYASGFVSALPWAESGPIHVWNPGCGTGLETYSLLMALKTHFPQRQVKIFANDNDLLAISNAPMLALPDPANFPEWQDFFVKGNSGFQLKTEYKNLILFEFHDISHMNPFYALDLIMARDVLCFLNESQQMRILDDFHEKLKRNGVLVLGDNERVIDSSLWEKVQQGNLIYYKKK